MAKEQSRKSSPVIGLLNDYDDCEPVTFEQLQEYCEDNKSKFTLQQYLDMRVSTNLTRFNYDPWSGEKIDYKVLRNRLFAESNNKEVTNE